MTATVAQAPLFAPPLPDGTVDVSDAAVGRPVIPWAPARRSVHRERRAPLPVWFVAVVALGVGGTLLAAAVYLWVG